MTFKNITAIKAANKAIGHNFFSPDTMRFFNSHVYPGVIGGRFFVTSEQFVGSDGVAAPRQFTVRRAADNGAVDTVGMNKAHPTEAEAREAAKGYAAQEKAAAEFEAKKESPEAYAARGGMSWEAFMSS